jgi:hypothetical protein
MIDYHIDRIVISRGFDGRTFWAQARAGVIPGREDGPPVIVTTAQPTLRSGSDVYFALWEWRSYDLGETWEGPIEHADTLGRRQEPDEVTVAICDMTPRWHAATQTLLATGQTVRYRDDRHPITARRREPAYAVYDPTARTWTAWRTVAMPDRPAFESAGAGSTQRFDLADGTILLPIYFKKVSDDWHACHTATVMRCAFDGTRLTYLEHGTELTVSDPRGFCEPSITRYRGRYYLTLRNDVRGYVAVSGDGLHFSAPMPWRFDNGTELGNYNTQQHWVTHSDGLFLVYTRRGLDNDHVFRHRAPLMMAQVDPENLMVLKATERELVPNRGARLGNFGACDINEHESWVIAAEWMQPEGCEAYGSDNTIWAARILWEIPNRMIE